MSSVYIKLSLGLLTLKKVCRMGWGELLFIVLV